MRLAFWLAILAFALGAIPARAQDSPGIIPKVQEPAPEAKPAAKPAAKSPAGKPHMVKAAKEAKKEAKAAPQKSTAKPEPVKADASKSGPAKSSTTKSEPTPEALAGIPADERPAVQSALLWSGDYTGSIGGDDPMLAAIKNYQKRSKAKITGELTAAERANLIAAAHDHEQEFGWSVVVDPATGIRIGLPTKLVPQARDATRGTRWSSAHGEVQVETFRIKTTDLAALFEREKKEPKTRTVEYSVMHRDNFFISGMQGLKKFSVKRADARRRGARLHHALRSNDGRHCRAGDGGDGERVFAVPRAQRAVRGAGEAGRIRHRADRQRRRRHRHRPQAHRKAAR